MCRRTLIASLLLAALALSACGAREEVADSPAARVLQMVVRDAAGQLVDQSSWSGQSPADVDYKIMQVDARLMALRARRPGSGLTVILEGGAVSRTYTLDASLRGSLFRLDQDIKTDRL
ncbi:MAG: hypothetical protein KC503_02400 [Myxococcales bacterium]|nr:hypothetical protein [Myxococcales bacterium]